MDHDCDLPSLDFLPFGEEWVCPACGKKWMKAEFDREGSAYWEDD